MQQLLSQTNLVTVLNLDNLYESLNVMIGLILVQNIMVETQIKYKLECIYAETVNKSILQIISVPVHTCFTFVEVIYKCLGVTIRTQRLIRYHNVLEKVMGLVAGSRYHFAIDIYKYFQLLSRLQSHPYEKNNTSELRDPA